MVIMIFISINTAIKFLLFFLIILFITIHALTLVNQGAFYYAHRFSYKFFLYLFGLIWCLLNLIIYLNGREMKIWRINMIEKYFLLSIVLYMVGWLVYITPMDIFGFVTKTDAGYVLKGHFKTRVITDQQYQLFDLLKARIYLGWETMLYISLCFLLSEKTKE
jgi:hypothetical protein